MEITKQSRLIDVLNTYPELEAHIATIAPPFKDMTNAAVRHTVGKLTTLQKVAEVGEIDADQLVNTLRKIVGQEELTSQPEAGAATQTSTSPDLPDWVVGEPAFVVNGTEILARGEVPLLIVVDLLKKLPKDQYILLLTNFQPSPIMENMKKQKRRVFHEVSATDEDQHRTYIS